VCEFAELFVRVVRLAGAAAAVGRLRNQLLVGALDPLVAFYP